MGIQHIWNSTLEINDNIIFVPPILQDLHSFRVWLVFTFIIIAVKGKLNSESV